MEGNTETRPSGEDTSVGDEDADYYRHPQAAPPEAGEALYLNHPEHGWLPVLDHLTYIERDIVAIALGDDETGAFLTVYRSDYEYVEDMIFDAKRSKVILEEPTAREQDGVEPADEIVEQLPSTTPGRSNLNERDH